MPTRSVPNSIGSGPPVTEPDGSEASVARGVSFAVRSREAAVISVASERDAL